MTERKELKGYVHSLESFGSVDGPGIRFVIFLSGCRMRCQFCHNPDTWDMENGKLCTAAELVNKAKRCSFYWGENGGITVSGGEPLLQIDFLTELFQKAKQEGIHTTLDTSGGPFTKKQPFFGKFQELLKYTDLIMLDIKQIKEKRHRALTGCSNRNILALARYLSDCGQPAWIRHVLVPQRTDYDEDLKRLAEFIETLHNVERVEVLPYHTLGAFKWRELGIPYPLNGIELPTEERIENAKKLLHIDV